MPTQRYRFVGDHVESLSDGTTLEPGEFYDLDSDSITTESDHELVTMGKLLKSIESEPVNASPAAVQLASDHGIDLSEVHGTGTGGQITKPDVEGFLAAAEGSN